MKKNSLKKLSKIFQGKPIHHTIEEAIEFYEKSQVKKKNIKIRTSKI